MNFKGEELQVGDHIGFVAPELSCFPHVEAVIIEIKDGVLDVVSNMLGLVQHKGLFREEEIDSIWVIAPASRAIPIHARDFFKGGERVALDMGEPNGIMRGNVVAAYEGLVIARDDKGQTFYGGVVRFWMDKDTGVQ